MLFHHCLLLSMHLNNLIVSHNVLANFNYNWALATQIFSLWWWAAICGFLPCHLTLLALVLHFLVFALAPEDHSWSGKPAWGFKSCLICLSSDISELPVLLGDVAGKRPALMYHSEFVFPGAFTHSLSSLKSALLMPKFCWCFPSCHHVLNSIVSGLLCPWWLQLSTSLTRPSLLPGSKSRRASFLAGSLRSSTWG